LLPQELVGELLSGQRFRVERIVSKGHRSPDDFWYDQSEHEWVVVLQGEARLWVAGQPDTITLSAGMYINLPAHVKHRVEWTHQEVETIWLAIFYSAEPSH
jgi:cupin 2 domain-containing protein